MSRYLKKLGLFLSPFAVLYGLLALTFFVAGEFRPIETILANENKNLIIGKAYVPIQEEYERQAFFADLPEVTTLGNSRVLPFRQEFFNSSTTFYNLGFSGDLFLYRSLLQTFPERDAPKLVLVALEQSMFNADVEHDPGETFSRFAREAPALNVLSLVSRATRDVLAGKIDFKKIFTYSDCFTTVGINARVNQNGFRPDGSWRYGAIISDPENPENEDYGFRDTLRRIDRGVNLFAKGETVSEPAIEELTRFLEEASRRSIHVVAFLPPYAPSIYKELSSRGVEYGYMVELRERLPKLFKQSAHTFFDFTDGRILGLADSEFIDGFHGGELAYLKMFLFMAKYDPLLTIYTDPARLLRDIESTSSRLEVYGCASQDSLL